MVNKAGRTPLNTAVRAGSLQEARQLLTLGKYGISAGCLRNNSNPRLRHGPQSGANPNIMDAEGFLPIHHACMVAARSYEDLLNELLRRGENQAVLTREHKVGGV